MHAYCNSFKLLQLSFATHIVVALKFFSFDTLRYDTRCNFCTLVNLIFSKTKLYLLSDNFEENSLKIILLIRVQAALLAALKVFLSVPIKDKKFLTRTLFAPPCAFSDVLLIRNSHDNF